MQRAREEDGAHRLASAFVVKVALSAPSASGRAFADTWADLIGAYAAGCSRRTTGRVRDAFSDVVNDLCFEQVEQSARRASAARAEAYQLAAAYAPEAALAPGAAPPPSDFRVMMHIPRRGIALSALVVGCEICFVAGAIVHGDAELCLDRRRCPRTLSLCAHRVVRVGQLQGQCPRPLVARRLGSNRQPSQYRLPYQRESVAHPRDCRRRDRLQDF